MLGNGMKETMQRVVELKKCNARTFRAALDFIYFKDVELSRTSEALELLECAMFYHFEDLYHFSLKLPTAQLGQISFLVHLRPFFALQRFRGATGAWKNSYHGKTCSQGLTRTPVLILSLSVLLCTCRSMCFRNRGTGQKVSANRSVRRSQGNGKAKIGLFISIPWNAFVLRQLPENENVKRVGIAN